MPMVAPNVNFLFFYQTFFGVYLFAPGNFWLKDKGNTYSRRRLKIVHSTENQFDSMLAARRFVSITNK